MTIPAAPIDPLLPRVVKLLTQHPAVVLHADPGAGKTTRVPLALLEAPEVSSQKIVMLEPRRLAAVSAAHYMARLLAEPVGERIGYRIRGEARISARTRIEVVTEGVLTRLLQDDPSLEGIGVVIFDEFHERSLHADLGLAFARETQELVRPDLKLLVMSATLESDRISTLLGGAPIVRSEGRAFPVETRHRPRERDEHLDRAVAAAVREALREHQGDLLAFLPGRSEIHRTAQRLEGLPGVELVPLYSEVGLDMQRRALAPAAEGQRKVILATSIAETSLTISGVRIVVDSGVMRVPRFDPGRAMTGLVTVPVSKASADQRRGRSGREAPGVCYRLWSEGAHASLPPFTPPEILNSDLVPLALELAAWGCHEPATLAFLDPPPLAHLEQAVELLKACGALTPDGRITEHGRAMVRLGIHPRLAQMVLTAKRHGSGALACDIAALLEERDPLSHRDAEIDLGSRLELLRSYRADQHHGRADVLSRIATQATRLRRAIGAGEDSSDAVLSCGALLSLAYPDRIGARREPRGRRYLLAHGGGAELPAHSLLTRAQFLVVADLEGSSAHAKVFLAEEVGEDELRELHAGAITRVLISGWDSVSESVLADERETLGAIVLSQRPAARGDVDLVSGMIEGIRSIGLSALPWSEAAHSLRERSEWYRRHCLKGADAVRVQLPWPDLSDLALQESLERWLAPFLSGVRSRKGLSQIDLHQALAAQFSYEQRKTLDEMAPRTLTLPTGTPVKIDYSTEPPSIEAVLQELLGQGETPRIAGGAVSLVVHLLSPARRPLQVTRDLASFWKNAYREVRKEMLGRYPKHVWPEDPASAAPTRRAKPRPGFKAAAKEQRTAPTSGAKK